MSTSDDMAAPDAAGGSPGRVSRDPPIPAPLPRSFHARPAPEVARALLGARIVSLTDDGALVAMIVETEAYLGPEDRASHARSGLTRRNSAMFGPPGHAYVYRVYGLHWCLNVVTGMDGEAEAVLIRAVVPERGADAIRVRRGRPGDPVARLTAGPACVCQGLGIDGEDDGRDLTAGVRLWIGAPAMGNAPVVGGAPADTFVPEDAIVTGPRVGVEYSGEPWMSLPFRFGIAGHASLSRSFRGSDRASLRPPTPGRPESGAA